MRPHLGPELLTDVITRLSLLLLSDKILQTSEGCSFQVHWGRKEGGGKGEERGILHLYNFTTILIPNLSKCPKETRKGLAWVTCVVSGLHPHPLPLSPAKLGSAGTIGRRETIESNVLPHCHDNGHHCHQDLLQHSNHCFKRSFFMSEDPKFYLLFSVTVNMEGSKQMAARAVKNTNNS